MRGERVFEAPRERVQGGDDCGKIGVEVRGDFRARCKVKSCWWMHGAIVARRT